MRRLICDDTLSPPIKLGLDFKKMRHDLETIIKSARIPWNPTTTNDIIPVQVLNLDQISSSNPFKHLLTSISQEKKTN